jgi:diaminohydroxyphosphoribosylaminopyrimidine deaminase / 5-amino-6-(5-phosphoribosylamino)uracil reductase
MARGVRVEQVQSDGEGRVDLHAVMRRLGEREVTSIIVEGGSRVNGAALAAGVVDKVFLYYAPKVLGEAGAIPFAQGLGQQRRLQIRDRQMHRFGEDVAVEGYLRDPYEE